MARQHIWERIVATLIAAAFLFHAFIAAQGLIVCEEANGTRRIEIASARSACHGSQSDAADPTLDKITSPACTDTVFASVTAVSYTSGQSLRFDPAPVPLPAFRAALLAVVELKETPPPVSIDLYAPASEQHALLLSSVVLLI